MRPLKLISQWQNFVISNQSDLLLKLFFVEVSFRSILLTNFDYIVTD